jgi:hypothetical protein
MDENDENFLAETFRRESGGSAYRLTHIATGTCVVDEGASDVPVVERWSVLRKRLHALIGKSN